MKASWVNFLLRRRTIFFWVAMQGGSLVAPAEPISPSAQQPGRLSAQEDLKVDRLGKGDENMPFPSAEELKVYKPFSAGMGLANPMLRALVEDSPPGLNRDELLPKNSTSVSALQYKFSRALRSQDWNQALEDVVQLLEARPGDIHLHQKAGMLYAIAKRFLLAEKHLSMAMKADPNDVPTISARAYVLLHLARLEESREVTEIGEKLAPSDIQIQYVRSLLDIAQGTKQAPPDTWRKRSLQEQLVVATWLKDGRKTLLDILGEKGFAEACSFLLGPHTGKNLSLIPGCLHSAHAAVEGAKWSEAIVYLHLAKEYGVNSIPLDESLARCYFETGAIGDALRILNALTKTYPDSAPTWYNLGFILIHSHFFAEAETALERAMAIDRDEPSYAFAWVCALAGQGKLDTAWSVLDQLDRKYPEWMPGWVAGDAVYLKAIRSHSRYGELRVSRIVKP